MYISVCFNTIQYKVCHIFNHCGFTYFAVSEAVADIRNIEPLQGMSYDYGSCRDIVDIENVFVLSLLQNAAQHLYLL